MRRKPRLLMVARGRYRFPLSDQLRRKLDALEEEFELHLVGAAAGRGSITDPRFTLTAPVQPARIDGVAFLARLPLQVARAIRGFRPDAVLVQGAHETAAALAGRSLSGLRPPVILDLHGDWRAATRLYGSPLRRILDVPAERVAETAVRRADAIRTISDFTSGLVRDLGREPAAVFPAYVDLESFLSTPPQPLPEAPQALFVGVLERYKNVDGLVAAWRLAAPHAPGARLSLVGRGRQAALVEQLVSELPGQTTWTPHLAQPDVAAALDAAWFLLLPSRSEGLPRIAMEAFCRGRAVVGSREGGIPDIVEHDVSGLLVDAGEPRELADAIVRVLSDRRLAERLGAGAAAAAGRWIAAPDEFARRTRELVDRALAGARSGRAGADGV